MTWKLTLKPDHMAPIVRKIARKFRYFFRLSARQRWLLLEALAALALARILMLLVPFRFIARWLGTVGEEGPESVPSEDQRRAMEISWTIDLFARHVPWDGRCLARAIAGTLMLRRRKLEGTVYFGGRMEAPGKLAAHAWLRYGSIFLTGKPEHESFKRFTSFFRR